MDVDDNELKKAFFEMQTKQQENSRKLSSVKSLLATRERELRMSQLTFKELSSLDKGVSTYKAVGKMFVLCPLENLQSDLGSKIEFCQKDSASLIRQQDILQKEIMDCQQNIKEMLEKRQS